MLRSSRWTGTVQRMLALVAVTGTVLASTGVRADPVPAADARAARAVVEAQLLALAAGDAERAFSFAAPGIRQQFGDAATFIGMVRQGYPMIVRPARTVFFVPQAMPGAGSGALLQPLQVRDAAGRTWLATYQLERQPDGRWRIGGCSVVADSDRSST